MWYYLDILKDKLRKDQIKKAKLRADTTILCRFGDLANELGF
jgi:hypothetical protein